MRSQIEELIKIVPLHPGDKIVSQPPAPAHLTYRNGPLLSSVAVFTIFWGKQWPKAPLNSLAIKLNQFFDDILRSSLIDLLKEYNTPAYQIGYGQHSGSQVITASSPPKLLP